MTFFGALLLLATLAGVAVGLYMALDRGTRGTGLSFALWWTPAAAASTGVMMHDPVTFLVGLFCFVVAGAALAIDRIPGGKSGKGGRAARERGGVSRLSKRTTTKRMRTRRARRGAAS